MHPRHLYVHAPFCARRCSYCDFAVQVSKDPPVEAWATCIGRELAAVVAEHGWSERLRPETLYLGGGTPSLLGPDAVDRLARAIAPHVALDGVVELTAEANPESFTPEVAEGWVRSGVSRVSFGAQTFHVPSLRWMGRLHGPDGPGQAVARARAAGVENVGLDLIFGLPERLGRDLEADLDRILTLEPEHVSVYGLSAEKGTPLGRWVEEGREVMPDQDQYGDEYLLVAERLTGAGYTHYEVSNFAKPGREAVHNAAYWRGVPYLGLGNGAHSFIAPRRWWNRRDWGEYRAVLEAGGSPRADEERVGLGDAALERLWLGLRTAEGVPASELAASQWELVAEWARQGWAECGSGCARLTPAGWLLLDRLTVELEAAGAAIA